eukprot:165322_1
MNVIASAAKKLHTMQLKRLCLMGEFSSTIHSCVDLERSGHIAKDENYFGQCVKMMASTMHWVLQLYSEYNDDLRTNMWCSHCSSLEWIEYQTTNKSTRRARTKTYQKVVDFKG